MPYTVRCDAQQDEHFEEVACQQLSNMCVLALYHRGRGEHITVCTHYMDAFYADNKTRNNRDLEWLAFSFIISHTV